MDCRIFVKGEIDLATAPALLADLHRAIGTSDADLILDCANLTFIDSTGVRALIEAHQALEALDRKMLLVNLARGPHRVFEVLGLTELFHIDRLITA